MMLNVINITVKQRVSVVFILQCCGEEAAQPEGKPFNFSIKMEEHVM